jgi:hypothetical protein
VLPFSKRERSASRSNHGTGSERWRVSGVSSLVSLDRATYDSRQYGRGKSVGECQIAIAKRIIRRQRTVDPDVDEDAARLAELVLEEHEEEA